MKRANEIIKKSKNSSLLGGRPDISDILHPLTDSFVTLTTADSLVKHCFYCDLINGKYQNFGMTSNN